MMFIHPMLQFSGLCLSLFVLYLGWKRFAFAHLGRKGLFPWKRHVLWGTVVMAVWLAGLGLGLSMAYWQWKIVFITGVHYQVALAMVPLMVFGFYSGYVMDRRKAKRKALPLAHGLNNLLLVLMTLGQLASGVIIIRDFLLP